MKKIVTFVLMLFFLSAALFSPIPSLAHARGVSTVQTPETNPEPPPPPED